MFNKKNSIWSGLILLIIIQPLLSTAQVFEGHYKQKVLYKLSYLADSNNAQRVSEEYMQLYLGDTLSLFQSINSGLIDSAIAAENKKGNTNGPSMTWLFSVMRTTPYFIFKTSQTITTYDQVVVDYYYYKEPREIFNWQIQDDTMRIGDFLCQKATTNFGGRIWNAWFAPEIPISDGPYKFCGLPGLILELSDRKNTWSFSFMGIVNADTTFKPIFRNKIPTFVEKKQTFFKNLKYNKDNYIEIQEAQGAMKFNTPEMRAKSIRAEKENRKYDNNWIEIYDSKNN